MLDYSDELALDAAAVARVHAVGEGGRGTEGHCGDGVARVVPHVDLNGARLEISRGDDSYLANEVLLIEF